jgi:hypothetical protein
MVLGVVLNNLGYVILRKIITSTDTYFYRDLLLPSVLPPSRGCLFANLVKKIVRPRHLESFVLHPGIDDLYCSSLVSGVELRVSRSTAQTKAVKRKTHTSIRDIQIVIRTPVNTFIKGLLYMEEEQQEEEEEEEEDAFPNATSVCSSSSVVPKCPSWTNWTTHVAPLCRPNPKCPT